MCEQAARYCRDGVHKLLNKEQGKLRAHDSRDPPRAAPGRASEGDTAAQSGHGGAQPAGFDGLVRWIVTKMSDNKNLSSREFASSKEEAAAAQDQFFAPEPRRGISVILDVSTEGWKDGGVRVVFISCSFIYLIFINSDFPTVVGAAATSVNELTQKSRGGICQDSELLLTR